MNCRIRPENNVRDRYMRRSFTVCAPLLEKRFYIFLSEKRAILEIKIEKNQNFGVSHKFPDLASIQIGYIYDVPSLLDDLAWCRNDFLYNRAH